MLTNEKGYRIIKEAPQIKFRAIVESECECPVCRKREEIKVTPAKNNNETFQNNYECPNCGTTWKGNLYDEDWNPQKKGLHPKSLKKYLVIVAYALMCMLFARANVFLAVGVLACNFIAAVAFALAGCIDSIRENKIRNNIYSVAFFVANVITIAGMLL